MSPQSPTPPGALVLAVDAGGTSTRALVLRRDGTLVGAARAAAGNPTSAGTAQALTQVRTAVVGALRAAGADPGDVTSAAFAMAGQSDLLDPDELASALGLASRTPVVLASDVLAMYHSAAAAEHGAVVVAGTGSIAAQVRGGVLHRVVGGSGWLLGDGGSGFATGRRVARAVVAELDGSGPPTALTGPLLRACGLRRDSARGADGRPGVLSHLISALYRERPVSLARFAPLAFAAHDAGDAVAAAMVAATHDELAVLVREVRQDAAHHDSTAGRGTDGTPLVLGGSVWRKGVLPRPSTWSPALHDALEGAHVRPARDGAVGAAVLALRGAGAAVEASVIEQIHQRAEDLL